MFISNAANISLIWSCFGNFLGYLRCCSSSNAILPYGRVLLDDGGGNLPLFFCRESLQHQQKDGYLSCYVMGLASIWIIAFLCPVSLAYLVAALSCLLFFPCRFSCSHGYDIFEYRCRRRWSPELCQRWIVNGQSLYKKNNLNLIFVILFFITTYFFLIVAGCLPLTNLFGFLLPL